jgi:hypothetical protein
MGFEGRRECGSYLGSLKLNGIGRDKSGPYKG